MKRKFVKPAVLCLLLAAALMLPLALPVSAGCNAVAEKSQIKLDATEIEVYNGVGYLLEVEGTNKKATWSSSDRKIATVNSKGMVMGKKPGSAVITCKVAGWKLKCTVTVLPTLSVNKTKLKITKGDKGIVKCTYALPYQNVHLTYHIADEDIVSCKWDDAWDNGDIWLTVKGLKAGSTTITITNDMNKEKIKIKVKVQ